MATVLLKGVPGSLRDLLKRRAAEHRRSMNQEAVMILQQALQAYHVPKPASWAKPLKALTLKAIRAAIREGRQ